jgi:predicted Zn-dependent protease with MMP-like domain
LLGYYLGTPLAARGDFYGIGATMPDTITIYQLPILEMADDELGPDALDADFEERVKQIVAETVWHEFAHHFGMDEHEVRAREAQRDTPFDEPN